jgi:molybdopterin-guanine dinucleotide biosynthesis protein A
MGTSKALLRIDGQALAVRVADVLVRGGATSVVAVGGPAAQAEELGLRWVADRWPGEGPLAAVASALADAHEQHGPDAVVVVAACDQPDLSGPLVASLVQALDAAPSADAAIAATTDGRRHPLPAAWRARAAARVAALVEGGARRADAPLGERTVVVSARPQELIDLDDAEALARWRSTRSDPGGP